MLCGGRGGWKGEVRGEVFVYHTFIAISNRVKVDVVLVVADEEEAEPGVEGVDGHDEENTNDVALLVGNRI